jgi:tryptophanyl-tRNA synthetase
VAAGFLIYPVSQAADILAFKANVVPVGVDQVPHIEQGNELAHKFNTIYNTSIFPKIEAKLSETPRLVGIDGNSKMSKSLGNTINFSDTNEEIEAKVKMMYTDPGHIHVEDPGEVLGNVVFNYLDIFDPNKAEVAELKAQYQKGGLGDMVIKKRLTGILQEMITPIRERREYLARDPKHIMDILEAGTEKARETARETLREVKEAMKINYF